MANRHGCKTVPLSIADFSNIADFPGKRHICPPRRHPEELLAFINDLDQHGIELHALKSPMDTATPASRAFRRIQAAFAEMERNVIRQSEGVKIAMARGSGSQPGRNSVW